MHYGWLKLIKTDGLPVFVWAVDTEMIEQTPSQGSVVYLHHDKIEVVETPEWIIGQIEEISRRGADEEKGTPLSAG